MIIRSTIRWAICLLRSDQKSVVKYREKNKWNGFMASFYWATFKRKT